MLLRTDVPFLACCAVCLTLMPLFIVGTLIALIVYAVFSVVTDLILSGDSEVADAREVAQHLCAGHEVRHL
jgi:hypothetical protein